MRPTLDQYLMRLAQVAATRSTCVRRSVGCVLADAKGRVLSIAYNGVPAGAAHCRDGLVCYGTDLPPGQDSCEAVHAEQNAILQCREPDAIHTAYVTLSPCKPCLKLLLNTGCRRIVVLQEHEDVWPKMHWESLGREWEVLE